VSGLISTPTALTTRLRLPRRVRACGRACPDQWRLERGGESVLYDPERVDLITVDLDHTRAHRPGERALVLPVTVLHVVGRGGGTSRTWEWDGHGLFLAYTIHLPKDLA